MVGSGESDLLVSSGYYDDLENEDAGRAYDMR